MKLIAQLKLQTTKEQASILKRTLEMSNSACNFISHTAWHTKTFGKFELQKLCYTQVRETFGLSAQMTVRALAKVGDSYKLDKNTERAFRPLASIAYDDRILSYNHTGRTVSIWTLDGRQTIPFVCGDRQGQYLQTRMGESDLVLLRGEWYLFAVCEIEEPEPIDVIGVIGVDLGVTNIATDSDGTIYSGKAMKYVRYRHRRLRTKLQKKGTKSARRRLQKLAGQERRFAADVNHVLSKQIVAKAKDTRRALALENLKHIRSRVTVCRPQRVTLHSWAFHQLRIFITYKAVLAGVTVHVVDPRNTSRTCPQCGRIDKNNRKTQASFICTSCSFAGHADVIAAGNISRRAIVMQPYVSGTDTSVAPGTSRRL